MKSKILFIHFYFLFVHFSPHDVQHEYRNIYFFWGGGGGGGKKDPYVRSLSITATFFYEIIPDPPPCNSKSANPRDLEGGGTCIHVYIYRHIKAPLPRHSAFCHTKW